MRRAPALLRYRQLSSQSDSRGEQWTHLRLRGSGDKRPAIRQLPLLDGLRRRQRAGAGPVPARCHTYDLVERRWPCSRPPPAYWPHCDLLTASPSNGSLLVGNACNCLSRSALARPKLGHPACSSSDGDGATVRTCVQRPSVCSPLSPNDSDLLSLRLADSYFGIVGSAQEAQAILEACKLGVCSRARSGRPVKLALTPGARLVQILPRVTRRLTDEEYVRPAASSLMDVSLTYALQTPSFRPSGRRFRLGGGRSRHPTLDRPHQVEP